ncbi:MAG: ATP-binding protein [Sphingomonadaceae bacterium]
MFAREASASALRKPRSTFPIVLGFLIILAVAAASTWLVRETRNQYRAVAHTLQVLTAAADVDRTVSEANSTQRGWMITRSDLFRERFADAYGQIWPNHAELAALVADNPAQADRARQLGQELQARVAEYDRIDRAVLAGDLDTAIDRMLIARSQTDRIRQIIEAIVAEENQLLALRQRKAERANAWLLATSLIGLLLLLLLAASALRTFRSYAAGLRDANAQATALNRELESRVAERTADLAEANEEIQRFAYIVSHDLRAPLVNVMGFTSEIGTAADVAGALVDRADAQLPGLVTPEERQVLTRELRESLGFIAASTRRMDALIRSILALSREGRRVLVPEPVDLDALLAELVDSFQTQIEATQSRVTVGPLPAIVTDRTAIGQILGNLLDNALKYLRAGVPGEISVTAEEAGSLVRITVADNGRGIAPEDRERVFELFRRAGAQDRPGEGLGLAHVRALARRMGGTIHLESRPGEGSRFTVSIPRHMAAEPVSEGASA